MRGKTLIIVMLVLIVASVGLFGCAPAATQEAAIKHCEVGVPLIETGHAGAEAIVLSPEFDIYNPNDYAVTVRVLRYDMTIEGYLAGTRDVILDMCVPAMGTGRVVGGMITLVPANWAGVISTKDGVTFAEGFAKVAPLWKNLDGLLFSAGLQDAWDAAPEKLPVFTIDGRIETRSLGGQELITDFSLTYQRPEATKPSERTAK
jgi:hypothetical protein